MSHDPLREPSDPISPRINDWMITRCEGGGCIHLHLERTVITLTPDETVALARLINLAVEQYRLSGDVALASSIGLAH